MRLSLFPLRLWSLLIQAARFRWKSSVLRVAGRVSEGAIFEEVGAYSAALFGAVAAVAVVVEGAMAFLLHLKIQNLLVQM